MSQQPQEAGKNWVFTLNNYTDEEVTALQALVPDPARYIVYQQEVGANGTPHLQGYIQFTKRKRLGGVKQCLGSRAHCEPRRGTHEQARDYCTKAETRQPGSEPVELGEPVRQAGQRTDLDAVKQSLDAGKSLLEIADAHFEQFCRYGRAFKEYKLLRSDSNRNWHTHCTVYHGPSGTGKSSRAYQEAGPDAFWLRKPQNGSVWWDGYNGQEHVVIDEFYGWLPRDLMQRLCDRYPMHVDTKGGAVPFLARRIWVTSNQSPDQWWRIGLGAMERRLNGDSGHVEHMVLPMPAGWVDPVVAAAVANPFPGPVPAPGSIHPQPNE